MKPESNYGTSKGPNQPVVLPSYAKINLGLSVCSKRPDGYHEIRTIFQQIDLADRLTFTLQKQGITLSCDAPNVPTDESNLCIRAARLLQMRTGRTEKGVHIHLSKAIPPGGGLGGGSSNAAVTLAALNHLWDLGLPIETLLDLARELGADVPFFLLGGTALASGIGDQLETLDLWEQPWVVVTCPSLHISTAWAYSALKIGLTKKGECGKFQGFLEARPRLSAWSEWLENDFEKVVLPAFPKLMDLRGELLEQGAEMASLSGSGACLFGLFAEQTRAQKAAQKVGEKTASFLARPTRWGYKEISTGFSR